MRKKHSIKPYKSTWPRRGNWRGDIDEILEQAFRHEMFKLIDVSEGLSAAAIAEIIST